MSKKIKRYLSLAIWTMVLTSLLVGCTEQININSPIKDTTIDSELSTGEMDKPEIISFSREDLGDVKGILEKFIVESYKNIEIEQLEGNGKSYKTSDGNNRIILYDLEEGEFTTELLRGSFLFNRLKEEDNIDLLVDNIPILNYFVDNNLGIIREDIINTIRYSMEFGEGTFSNKYTHSFMIEDDIFLNFKLEPLEDRFMFTYTLENSNLTEGYKKDKNKNYLMKDFAVEKNFVPKVEGGRILFHKEGKNRDIKYISEHVGDKNNQYLSYLSNRLSTKEEYLYELENQVETLTTILDMEDHEKDAILEDIEIILEKSQNSELKYVQHEITTSKWIFTYALTTPKLEGEDGIRYVSEYGNIRKNETGDETFKSININ